MAHLIAPLMAPLARSDQVGHAARSNTAHLQTEQLKQLVMLLPSLSSPLPSLIPPNIIRDTLYSTHHASPQESFPLITDLQGHPARSGTEHRATLQLQILIAFAAWHPPLLLGRAPVAQVRPCPADWSLIKERAEMEELESRWREGESSLLLAGVLAAPLSALSTLPLLNLLFRRASCLNGMILIKIINSCSES